MSVSEAFLDRFGGDCGLHLEVVAKTLGIEIREIDAASFDGALLRIRGIKKAIIVVNRAIAGPGRRRFTIAHELGHFVLPDQQGMTSPCGTAVIGSGGSMPSTERDANRFAAEILIPRRLATSAVTQKPTLALARALAERFGTSLTAAACRLTELSAGRVAIVMSQAGSSVWYRPSADFGRSVQLGPLDGSTLASSLFEGNSSRGGELVPADAWLFAGNLQSDARVFEESIALPAYEAVLTLLRVDDRIEERTEYDDEEMEPLDPEEFTLGRKRWR